MQVELKAKPLSDFFDAPLITDQIAGCRDNIGLPSVGMVPANNDFQPDGSHVHLTPTSSSWLNQVERFFALITERKIRRGIYRSVAALRTEITSFIERHNAHPKPFRRTKSADDILRSIERFCSYNFPPSPQMPRTFGSGH